MDFALLVWNQVCVFNIGDFILICGVCQEVLYSFKGMWGQVEKGKSQLISEDFDM